MGVIHEPASVDSAAEATEHADASLSAEVAFDRAYAEHWKRVFRFALAWSNDWAAAEDLAQEAYMRLWSKRSTIDWDRDPLPWLLVATRRVATDRFRSLRRRVLAPRPAQALDENVRVAWLDVQASMAILSPLERSALVFTAVEGYPSADVAAALGVTAGAVRAAAARARDKLDVAR